MGRLKLERAVVSVLTPDLLTPEWRRKARHPLSGHCYVASESLYHLLGKPWQMKPAVVWHEGATHWFLRNAFLRTDEWPHFIDLTADQFEEPVPYGYARGCGFLTKQPSKRAQIVIDRVLGV